MGHPGPPAQPKTNRPERLSGSRLPVERLSEGVPPGHHYQLRSLFHTHFLRAWSIRNSLPGKRYSKGFRKRHTYGATDNIILDFRMGDHFMGEEFTTSSLPPLEIRLIGTSEVASVEIIKNEEVIFTTTPNQQDVELTFMDQDATSGTSYYYVRVIQDDPPDRLVQPHLDELPAMNSHSRYLCPLLLLLFGQIGMAQPQPFAVQISFGYTDPEEVKWSGSVSADQANITSMEGWLFLPTDRISLNRFENWRRRSPQQGPDARGNRLERRTGLDRHQPWFLLFSALQSDPGAPGQVSGRGCPRRAARRCRQADGTISAMMIILLS